MGGTRCVFRDCRVNSTRNPRMHFFKFPVREPDRFKRWVELSGAKELLGMTPSQQCNRAVCGRHFRDESFMNFKKDRLCPNQFPTINRLSNKLALDFENLNENGEPRVIRLEKPSLPHLIPPPDFICPLDVDDDAEIVVQNRLSEENNKQLKDSEINNSQSDVREIEVTKKRRLDKSNLDSQKEFELTFNNNVNNSNNENNMLPTTNPTLKVQSASIDNKESRTNILDIIETHKLLKDDYKKLTDDYNSIKQAYLQLEAKYHEQRENCEKAVKSKNIPNIMPVQFNLTKKQLFCGVKKYLSSRMITLLRMEMFGNAERPWKADERQISVDILNFGDNVYNYLTDEWRFRLPALSDTRKWLKEGKTINIDEDL